METREQWLLRAAGLLQPHIEDRTRLSVNPYRIGVGDLGTRKIGLCWPKALTDDVVSEITISLRHATNPSQLLGTLVHEMIHAMGLRGHRRDFAAAGQLCGLSGKPTSMGFHHATPKYALPVIKALGPFPNPPLKANNTSKTQTTRLIKVQCSHCGMIWRSTKQWITGAVLRCPQSRCKGEQLYTDPLLQPVQAAAAGLGYYQPTLD